MSSMNRTSLAHLFTEIGVSLRTVFPDLEILSELYNHHKWMVIKNSNYHVVHAVPSRETIDNSFWEVWFIHKRGAVAHQILFSTEPDLPYHDIYTTPNRPDVLHPKEVLGRKWYVIEQPSLMAWGLQSALSVPKESVQ